MRVPGPALEAAWHFLLFWVMIEIKDDANVGIPLVIALHSAVLTGRGDTFKADRLISDAKKKK